MCTCKQKKNTSLSCFKALNVRRIYTNLNNEIILSRFLGVIVDSDFALIIYHATEILLLHRPGWIEVGYKTKLVITLRDKHVGHLTRGNPPMIFTEYIFPNENFSMKSLLPLL